MSLDPVAALQVKLGGTGNDATAHDAPFPLALQAQGFDIHWFDAIPFDPTPPALPENTKFVYGASQVIEKLATLHGPEKGIYQGATTLGTEACSEAWGPNMLNSDAQSGSVVDFLGFEPTGDTFVRPVADSKNFAGIVLSAYGFQQWVAQVCSADDFVGLDKNTKISVAPAKPINAEWRVFVFDGEVVTGSQYMKQGLLNRKAGLPEKVKGFATAMVGTYCPFPAFVIDVAASNNSLYVVELNGINASGFHHSDVNVIAKCIRRLVRN